MATHSIVLGLENPRDGTAWWAAAYGVAQSRTRLKRLSSRSRDEQRDDLTVLTSVIPGGSDSKESTCNAGDLGSIPGFRRSLGEGKGSPLHYSGLESPMDGTVHAVTESDTTKNL